LHQYGNSVFIIDMLPFSLAPFTAVVFNVGENAPRWRFHACGGDFVIYEIWGRFRFPGGRFPQVKTYSNV